MDRVMTGRGQRKDRDRTVQSQLQQCVSIAHCSPGGDADGPGRELDRFRAPLEPQNRGTSLTPGVQWLPPGPLPLSDTRLGIQLPCCEEPQPSGRPQVVP